MSAQKANLLFPSYRQLSHSASWRDNSSRIKADRLNALSKDTLTTYDRHWQLWVEWAHSPTTTPPSLNMVANFIDWLAYEKKWRAQSIKTVLGGLTTIFAL